MQQQLLTSRVLHISLLLFSSLCHLLSCFSKRRFSSCLTTKSSGILLLICHFPLLLRVVVYSFSSVYVYINLWVKQAKIRYKYPIIHFNVLYMLTMMYFSYIHPQEMRVRKAAKELSFSSIFQKKTNLPLSGFTGSLNPAIHLIHKKNDCSRVMHSRMYFVRMD